ncbi:MAG: ankyrin repeat domain-containing protein, partial [Pontiella sp.]|nr:ankyrin repeat domain-containing protein [Pontiella sp.]
MNTIRYLLIMLATALVLSCTTESEAPVLAQEVMEAALYGQISTIEKALDSDYNPNQRDPENRTALMYAAFNGHADIAQKLIAAGADVNLQDKIGST